MNKLLQRANKKIGVTNAAALLIVVSLVGQVLGFLRYKMVNANFSAYGAQSTDAYFAAFKIPDFFFFTFAAGALGVAFIPVLAERLEKGDRKGAWALTGSLLNLLALIMLVLGIIMFVFARPLIENVVGSGLTPEQVDNAVSIMRLISFNPFLFAVSGVLTNAQQAFGRFFFFAMGPIVYNSAIIASVLLFRDSIGLVGLGIGALAGAVLQLLVALLGLIDANFHWSPTIMWRNRDFKVILRQLPPRSVDQGVDSINSIVETNIASGLGTGSISFYENAYILHTTPTIVLGNTIATASFPQLSQRLAQNRRDLFNRDFLRVLRALIWITAPIVVISYFGRAYLARMIFAKDANEIALIFGYFAVAIFFRTIYAVISRWFYAQKDTVTPLVVSLFAIALNIFLAYTLSRPWMYGIAGLAIAQSIVAAAEVLVLGIIMLFRDKRLFNMEFWGGVTRIVSVTGFTTITTFIMIGLYPLQVGDRGVVTLGAKLALITAVTFAVHVSISLLFGLSEARSVMNKVRQIVLKPIKW
jgi:putative peptidoglycan lipid II flippase